MIAKEDNQYFTPTVTISLLEYEKLKSNLKKLQSFKEDIEFDLWHLIESIYEKEKNTIYQKQLESFLLKIEEIRSKNK